MLTLLWYSYMSSAILFIRKKAEKNKWVYVVKEVTFKGEVTGGNFLGLGMIAKDGDTHTVGSVHKTWRRMCVSMCEGFLCVMCCVYLFVKWIGCSFTQFLDCSVALFICLLIYFEICISGPKRSGWLVTGLGPSPTQFCSYRHWRSYLLSPCFRFLKWKKRTYIWFGQL